MRKICISITRVGPYPPQCGWPIGQVHPNRPGTSLKRGQVGSNNGKDFVYFASKKGPHDKSNRPRGCVKGGQIQTIRWRANAWGGASDMAWA